MTTFPETVEAWWAIVVARPPASAADRNAAHQLLLDAMRDVPAGDPLRQAVQAWITFQTDQVMGPATAGSWERREQLRDRIRTELERARGGA